LLHKLEISLGSEVYTSFKREHELCAANMSK
jgi:hypothetical protein